MLEGEDYGEFKTHSKSHLDYWDGLATSLKMPKHCSYDYHPRGRVNYPKTQCRYGLYLDQCLMKNRKLIRSITRIMHLSDQHVEMLTDDYYQCAGCNTDYIPDLDVCSFGCAPGWSTMPLISRNIQA
jgi:hypothetical protein